MTEIEVMEKILLDMSIATALAFIIGSIFGFFLCGVLIQKGIIKVSVRLPRYKKNIKYQEPTPGSKLVEQANEFRRERGMRK